MRKQEIKKILNDNDRFLELDNKGAQEWYSQCSFYLRKIKNHEVELKHTVRLYGVKNKDFNTDREEYRKVWICEDCDKVFLKCKFDPELLKIKEFYQMCYEGQLSNLAEIGLQQQINNLLT